MMEEDEIDELKLPDAIKTAKKHGIELSKLKTIHDIRSTLKRHLLRDRNTRKAVIAGLSSSAEHDTDVRQRLVDIYQSSITALQDLKTHQDPLISQLEQCFTDPITMLHDEQEKLSAENIKCPIMVLGETGAGKSSFINLILGFELLPHSLLSNTNTICEIRYDTQYRACFHFSDNTRDVDEKTFDSIEELQQTLSDKIQKKDQNQKTVYKSVEIFLPSDILKTGLLIVDSPGIADTGEMTDVVLDYLIKACAFIYIINSENAGGVSKDRLQDLLKKVIEKAFRDKQDYRASCALFVCNKWDQVPVGERKKVYDDTVKKLCSESTGWPDCKESQIFTLSTKEAMLIQQRPEGYIVGRFAVLLQKINSLIPESRNIFLSNSARCLQQVLDKALLCIDTSLSEVNLTNEQRLMKTAETVEELQKMKKDVDEFFQKQKSELDQGLNVIIGKLSKHLTSDEVMQKICSFTDSDTSKNKPWKEATVEVRSKLYDKITEEIQNWETDQGELMKLGSHMTEQFKHKFPDFDSKLFDLQRKYIQQNQTNRTVYDDEDPFVPHMIAEKFGNFNIGLKVLVGVSLSPVFLIGAIVRLPVWGVKELVRKIEGKLLSSEYNKDQNLALRKYAENILRSTCDPIKMKPIMEYEVAQLFNYLDQQRSKTLQQIDVELDLFERRKEEKFEREYSEKNYSAQKVRFERLRRRLLYFYKMEMVHDNASSPSVFAEDEMIHEGVMADLYRAKVNNADNNCGNEDVLIRKCRQAVDDVNIIEHIKIEEAYRSLRYVHNLPLVTWVIDKPYVWQVLAPVKCSLREHLHNEMMPGNEKIQTLYTYIQQIVSGLDFLNQKRLVHIDLSLDSVMVDRFNKIKLVNINYPQKIPAEYFPQDSTDLRRFVHFHRDVLSDPSQRYYHIHDMYSVGIMMWEVWKRQRAFSQMTDVDEGKTLKDFVKYLSDDKNQLSLDIEDGLGIPQVNAWNDGICKCQALDLTADRLLQIISSCKNVGSDFKHAQVVVQRSAKSQTI